MADKPYTHQHFPKWMYHPTELARTVKDQDELEALGDDWVDSPEKVGQVKPTPTPVSGGVGTPDPVEDHDEDEDEAQEEETAEETAAAGTPRKTPQKRK